jgi:hypothetical protein
MLKWLAMLAVFLAVAQASVPVPRQAVEAAAQGSGKSENQSQSKQGAATQTLPFVASNKSPITADQHGGQVAAEDEEHSVKLTSLPPITVTSQEKTIWDHVLDWGPWVFDFGLVAVGILQVVLLKWTWKAIERQANIMDKGAKDAHESGAEATRIALATAKAAQASAAAASAQIQMMKDKERARISVSVSDVEFEINMVYSFDAINIAIGNDGTTSAFNVRAKGDVFGQPSEDLPPMRAFISLTVPSAIRANDAPTQAEVILVQDIELTALDESAIPYFFHIGGIVEYDDVFGESHETTFRYRLKVNGVLQIPDSKSVKIRSWGGWKRHGAPEENRAT